MESRLKSGRETKQEQRILTDTNQFIQIADKLMGTMNLEDNNLKETGAFGSKKCSEKFNIVGGKLGPLDHNGSKFVLPKQKERIKEKPLSLIHKSTDPLNINLIEREKQRDSELKHKLQQLNLKQAARIKEIREAEERQKDTEFFKLLQSSKQEYNDEMQPFSNRSPAQTSEDLKQSDINNSLYQKTVQQFIDAGDAKTKFDSNDKSYFNKPVDQSKSSDLPYIREEKTTRVHSLSKNLSVPHDLTNSVMGHSVSQRTFNQMTTTSVNWGSKVNRTKEDVSFLREHSFTARAGANKIPFPFNKSCSGLLMSQSQITSGDTATDEYFQVALGLRSIGRSIIDMPRTIEDLKVLSKQYHKNMGAIEQTQDEKIYLSYIEEHYLATSKKTTEGDARSGNSPIRDLQEFYIKMFAKLNVSEGNISVIGRSKRNHILLNSSQINVKDMSASEIINLEKSPPRIDTNRKKIMLIDNTIMDKFGKEAFRIEAGEKNARGKALTTIQNTPKKSSQIIIGKEITPQTNVQTGYTSRERDVEKHKLLHSLTDTADMLTKPSIKEEEPIKSMPGWMKKQMNIQAKQDLGKPSARQDAVLLAKWFHDILDVIEQESIASAAKRQRIIEYNRGRLFNSQKTFEDEIQQIDTFHFVQIAHNIAVKEITRQISVQCVERGILLKSVFDSYVRLVDLVYNESLNMRRILASKFATVFEKQIKKHEKDLMDQFKITKTKDDEILKLKEQLIYAERREQGLRATNKQVVKLAMRNQNFYEQEQKLSAALDKQVKFLEVQINKLQEQIDPKKLDKLQQDIKRNLHKINKETLASFQPIKKQQIPGVDGAIEGKSDRYELKNEDIIKEADKTTNMDGFEEHLERDNGGPLRFNVEVEAIEDKQHAETSVLDLKEMGLYHDKQTEVDLLWRTVTRTKYKKRAKTQPKEIIGVLENFSDIVQSDNTSTASHLQYNTNIRSKSFNASIPLGKKILPILKKRALSLGNFNVNNLIKKKIDRLQREKQAKIIKAINSNPIMKLRNMIGEATLKQVQDFAPDIYKIIMDTALKSKTIDSNFCSEILKEYMQSLRANNNYSSTKQKSSPRADKFSLKKAQIIKNPDQDRSKPAQKNTLLAFNDVRDNPSPIEIVLIEDKTNRNLNTSKSKDRSKAIQVKSNPRDNLNSQKNLKDQERSIPRKKPAPIRYKPEDHPQYQVTQKILKKKSIENKDMMPPKTLARYINVIYAQRTLEILGSKAGNKSKEVNNKRGVSNSPEQPTPGSNSMNKAASIEFSSNKAYLAAQQHFQSVTGGFTNKSVTNQAVDAAYDLKPQEPSLIEWVYDYMQQRYGLKNVADKKFKQIVCSCLKYKDKNPRIKMFGRFLELYDPLNQKDFKLYIEIQEALCKLVLNYSIQESDEVSLIPLSRAVDYFKQTFLNRLTTTSLNYCLRQLKQKASTPSREEQKLLHLNNAKEVIQIDVVAEFVISAINSLQNEKIKNIEDLFHAADLSATGIISFDEFKTLYKLIINQPLENQNQFVEIKRVFDDYAELHDDEEESKRPQRGLNLSAFERLCLEKDLFTIKAQNQFINQQQKSFLNVTEPHEAFNSDFNKIQQNLDRIYEQLQNAVNLQMNNDVSDKDKKRYLEMIDQMAKCIMYPVNQKIAFLTFKIVMETIKRAVLKNQIDKYMPINPSYIKSFKKTLLDAGTVRSLKINSVLSKLGTSMLTSLGVPPRSDPALELNDFRTDAIRFEIPIGGNLNDVDLSQLQKTPMSVYASVGGMLVSRSPKQESQEMKNEIITQTLYNEKTVIDRKSTQSNLSKHSRNTKSFDSTQLI